jgi:hypothetical protein
LIIEYNGKNNSIELGSTCKKILKNEIVRRKNSILKALDENDVSILSNYQSLQKIRSVAEIHL